MSSFVRFPDTTIPCHRHQRVAGAMGRHQVGMRLSALLDREGGRRPAADHTPNENASAF
jgi:hypothetical protein